MPQQPDTAWKDARGKKARDDASKLMSGDPTKDFQRFEDKRMTAAYDRRFRNELARGRNMAQASSRGEEDAGRVADRLGQRRELEDAYRTLRKYGRATGRRSKR